MQCGGKGDIPCGGFGDAREVRRTAAFVTFRGLDSLRRESYLRAHPDPPESGGALVRASAFRLEAGHF